MSSDFHSFVVFAEMRTGSNLLESYLNAFDGLECLGEAFNPHFIGYPNKSDLLGVTVKQRDDAPEKLLNRIVEGESLMGFRYFHDHDPRILSGVLDDRMCAKIILTRDPVQSYVSWKIAQQTGQWKLTDVRRRKAAKAHFDPLEFAEHNAKHAAFRQQIVRHLQVSGQTAFKLTYDDLQSVEVLNGLARFLGVQDELDKLEHNLKVQNPASLAEKVSNPTEMETALAAQSTLDLDQIPDFEPRRFAAVPSYVIGAKTPLIYLPIRSGPQKQVKTWMAALDGVTEGDLLSQLSQKQLRQWKRAHKGHRSFTVLRHPVARAHTAFCTHILGTGPQAYMAIRRTLNKRYGLPIPLPGMEESYDLAAHRSAFLAFLQFLKSNLNGQTAIRVDPAWCTQARVVQGFSQFALPDHVLREDELPDVLPELALRMGRKTSPAPASALSDTPFGIDEIYDDEIETLTASAYQRDYMIFGFDRFR